MLLVSSCVPVITWLCSCVMQFQSRPINWPLLTIESPVAQRLEHPTRSRRVVGSNPIWGSDFFRVLQTFHLSHWKTKLKSQKQVVCLYNFDEKKESILLIIITLHGEWCLSLFLLKTLKIWINSKSNNPINLKVPKNFLEKRKTNGKTETLYTTRLSNTKRCQWLLRQLWFQYHKLGRACSDEDVILEGPSYAINFLFLLVVCGLFRSLYNSKKKIQSQHNLQSFGCVTCRETSQRIQLPQETKIK